MSPRGPFYVCTARLRPSVRLRETLKNFVRHGEDTTEALRSIGILDLVLSSLRDQLADELAALD